MSSYVNSVHGPWTDEKVALLERLYYQTPELSTEEIGRRIGQSKNSVLSKVHRLGLTPRQNPIIRTGPNVGATKERKARVAVRLPTLASLAGAGPALTISMAPRPTPVPPRPRTTLTCQWVVDDTRLKQRFCDALRARDKPYCAEHCQRAYAGHRFKREGEAA